MPLILRPPAASASGSVTLEAPPAKSPALRALVAAAMAGGGRVTLGSRIPDDVGFLVGGLRKLGYAVTDEDGGFAVSGPWQGAGEAVTIDAGEGAAPARFLIALAARDDVPVTITGRGRLPERPMGPLLSALETLGVAVAGGPGLPVTIQGPVTRGGTVPLPGGISSQLYSALMLALPGCGHDVRLEVQGTPVSMSYVAMTREILAAFGVTVTPDLRIPGDARFAVATHEVERDWSAATVLLASASFLERPVRVPGLRLASQQPDRAAVEVLQALGLGIMETGGAVEAWGQVMRGGRFDMRDAPDAVPAIAALSTLAPEPVWITGAPHLRHKECDRIAVLASMLSAVGVDVREHHDGLFIDGTGPAAPPEDVPRLHVAGDHRMAMAAALLGLRTPVEIDDPGCVSKSFPHFFEQWPGTVSEV